MNTLTKTYAIGAVQSPAATQMMRRQQQGASSKDLLHSSGSDEPESWPAVGATQPDVDTLTAMSRALGRSLSVLATAGAAARTALTILTSLKAAIPAGPAPDAPGPDARQAEIAALQAGLRSVIGSAAHDGTNLLDGSNPSVDLDTFFTRTSSGMSLGKTTLDTSDAGMQLAGPGGLLAAAIPGLANGAGEAGSTDGTGTYAAGSILALYITDPLATADDYAAMRTAVASAAAAVTDLAGRIADLRTTVGDQRRFVSALSEALATGIGPLVDTEMKSASTREQSLETQRQLGHQPLSIANRNTQAILKLFE